jgi:hypothetical protein
MELRGFISCPNCNKTFSASPSRSRKNYYSYYHCCSPCNTRIKVEDTHAYFSSFLKTISLNDNSYALLLELIKEGFKEVGKENELGPKHHEQLAKQNDKLIRIQDLTPYNGLPEPVHRLDNYKLLPL